MASERPASVSVVAWFFIILGGLSSLSAIGYLAVFFVEGPSGDFSVFPGLTQLLIACSFCIAGVYFLSGSSRMRLALEFGSYLLMLSILIYGIRFSSSFGSAMPMVMFGAYLVPFIFVVKALRSEKVRSYAIKT